MAYSKPVVLIVMEKVFFIVCDPLGAAIAVISINRLKTK
jgi:hypothetical protein